MATYTYVLKDKDGHLVTLNFDRNIANNIETLFNIGDTLNFSGSVYNSGGNDVGTFTKLEIVIRNRVKASIPISVPVGKTVSFSSASITFTGEDCDYNDGSSE